jgi:hypothetical protein
VTQSIAHQEPFVAGFNVSIPVCQLYKLVSLERSLNTTDKGLFKESGKHGQPQTAARLIVPGQVLLIDFSR